MLLLNGLKNSTTPQTRLIRIMHFIGNKDITARKRLLVGLNMYGTLFSPSRRPIIGREYIELLDKYKPELNWDSESEESFWEFNDEEGEGEVWFPSLFSIRYILLTERETKVRKRLNLVEDLEVGGISLWELGQVISSI
jgi:spore germination protein YaaH